MRAATVVTAILACASLAEGHETSYDWMNWTLPDEIRVDALVSALNLEEKCTQLSSASPAIPRLGVPSYHWRNNVLHGVVDNGKSTMFPQAIGLAATWDEPLLYESAEVWAQEQRAMHNKARKINPKTNLSDSKMNFGLDLWGPNINMFVHPLWGRGQETYGEDPVLTGALAAAVVKGLQQVENGILKTIATPKHFAAYTIDAEPPRLEIYEAISETDLLQYYLPAFQDVVSAGAESIMCSYNGINTTFDGLQSSAPMCMSPLLHKVLRKKFGFQGYVVTDSGALNFMVTRFKRYAKYQDAAAAALHAGVDLNSGGIYASHLPLAVKEEKVTEALVDHALRKLLKARMKLGLFNPIDIDPFSNITEDVLNSPKHRRVALRAAHESLVLLKNHKGILPLQSTQGLKIAVVGPAAKDAMRMAGNYYGCSYGTFGALLPECKVETPFDAIEKAAIERGMNVSFVRGTAQDSQDKSEFEAATNLAQNADVVLAFVGLRNCFPDDRPQSCEGEGKDRKTLRLPGVQHDLLQEIQKTKVPIVVVLQSGGPVALYEEAQFAHAIVAAWYGGSLGAQAIADVLFGVVSPSGRLPVTFPLDDSQVATPLGMGMEDYPGRTYRYMKHAPLYAFGFGLSYSTFRYGRPVQIGAKVCVEVQNTGSFGSRSREVVMLFASYEGPLKPLSKPVKQMVNFASIHLDATETRTVCIPILRKNLKLIYHGELTLLPGRYQFSVGGRAPGNPGMFVDTVESLEPLPLEIVVSDDKVELM